jgi:hypothetical protein
MQDRKFADADGLNSELGYSFVWTATADSKHRGIPRNKPVSNS